MKRFTILFLFCMGISTFAQDKAIPARVLVSVSSKRLEVPAFGYYGHGQCDKDGNFYFHTTTENINDPSILKLSSESWEPTIFKASDADKKMYYGGYSVTPSGGVWILANSGGFDRDQYVFEFDSSGNPTGKTKLEVPTGVAVQDFAVSDRGTILIAGYFGPKSAEKMQGQSFVGLFQPSGKLLRRLDDRFEGVDFQTVQKSIHAGSAVFGDDGNLYLLHGQIILVISEAGTLIRRISFDKPDKNSSATNIAISGGWIAIWLSSTNDKRQVFTKFLVLDSQTEQPYAIYSLPPEVSGEDGPCFNRKDGFELIGVEAGRLTLTHAALR